MKYPIKFVVFLLLASSCGNAQKKEIEYDPIVLRAKETSLYSERVDWVMVNSKFVELTKDKQGTEELKPGLQFLINSLVDKHAAFRSAKNHSLIVSYTGEISETSNRDGDFMNTVINDISARFSYQLLDPNVGYLKVVGIGPGIVKEQADHIREGLVSLKAEGVDKWILDLRFNGGGNFEPMLSGLAPLLGEGFVGGAINHRNEIRAYSIESGQLNNSGRIACEMSDLPKIGTNEKVAVLLSRYTASSGEMVAIAFKGREHTKFIGEDTAGYTTGNGYDPVNDELVMLISQDVFIDRNKIKYDKKVGVDEYMEFQHGVSIQGDAQITRAIQWLQE